MGLLTPRDAWPLAVGDSSRTVATLGSVRGRGPSLATGGTSEAKHPGVSAALPLDGGTFYHGEAVAVGMLYTSEGEANFRSLTDTELLQLIQARKNEK